MFPMHLRQSSEWFCKRVFNISNNPLWNTFKGWLSPKGCKWIPLWYKLSPLPVLACMASIPGRPERGATQAWMQSAKKQWKAYTLNVKRKKRKEIWVPTLYLQKSSASNIANPSNRGKVSGFWRDASLFKCSSLHLER